MELADDVARAFKECNELRKRLVEAELELLQLKQNALSAVVLPEPEDEAMGNPFAIGWNAYGDKFKELNKYE